MKKIKLKTVKGTISIAARGFGFVTPEDGSLDIFIPKRFINGAIDKDFVEVLVSSIEKVKGPEGEILKIIKRGRSHLVATILDKKHNYYVGFVSMIGTTRYAHIETSQKLKEGDRVLIKVEDWADENLPIIGSYEKLFGNINNAETDIPVAITEYGLEEEFSKQTILDAKKIKEIDPLELEKRKDFTSIECFTIDPTTAKDYDDAVSCTQDEKGFHLGVHIADVAHYVQPESHLDKDAFKRCNSTYFPGFCLPMLPFELSNEMCSLKEGVIRLCISVMMDFDKHGNLHSHHIYRSFIKSKKRFTYEEAFEVIQKKKTSPFRESLQHMVDLCKLLKQKRLERGSIDFALSEASVQVDDKGNPTGIKIIEYDISHQLVEEFMLKANECVAIYLNKKGKMLIYRIHEEPSKETFEEFYSFAQLLGFRLPKKPNHKDIQKLFADAKGSPHLHQLSINFIRSMKMAFYSQENLGHYGLALEHYCHFTSPIRRYSDLVIQRLLFNEEGDHDLKIISKTCSQKERISFKAEMSVVFLKKMRLLQKYYDENPKKEYVAIITKVKPHSISFEIKDLFLEGSLHVSELTDDYYIYYPEKMKLQGQWSKLSFSYGDEISVKIHKISFPFLKIEWKIVERKKIKKKK